MKVHSFETLHPSLFYKPVVTIGIFDGVHRGHLKILDRVKYKAQEIGGESVAITLWPHPRLVLNPEKDIKLITTLDEKIEHFCNTGIKHLIIVPFSYEFANQTAEEFVQNILVNKIGIKHFVVGFDNHIGHNHGGFETIRQLGEKFGFGAEQLSGIFIEEEKISSSNVRYAIESGNIDKANYFLGYQYNIKGRVVEGKKIGRSIGYPTANLVIDSDKMVPGLGIYATKVHYQRNEYPGMLSIGTNPTFKEKGLEKTIEVHIIGFEGDLYNKEISITFVSRLREEKKFASAQDLVNQLNIDKANTLKALNIQL